jgi:hypothetical protein
MTDIKNAKNLRDAMYLFFGPPTTPKIKKE